MICARCSASLNPASLYCSVCNLQHTENKHEVPAADKKADRLREWYHIAKGYLELGDYEQALELFRHLTRISPTTAAYWEGIVISYTHDYKTTSLSKEALEYLEMCAKKANMADADWERYRQRVEKAQQRAHILKRKAKPLLKTDSLSIGRRIAWTIEIVLLVAVFWWLRDMGFRQMLHTFLGFLAVHGILLAFSFVSFVTAIAGNIRYGSLPATVFLMIHAVINFLTVYPSDAGWFWKVVAALFFGFIELAMMAFSLFLTAIEAEI